MPSRAPGRHAPASSRAPSRTEQPRSSQRTNGVVVPPAGSASGSRPVIPAGAPRGASGSPLDALSGVSRHGSQATFAPGSPRGSHRPALASAPADATPLGHRREGRSVARPMDASRRPNPSGSGAAVREPLRVVRLVDAAVDLGLREQERRPAVADRLLGDDALPDLSLIHI